MSAPTTSHLRAESLNAVKDFTDLARNAPNGREAADWSLAAKNSVAVALACVQAEATLAKALRERRGH